MLRTATQEFAWECRLVLVDRTGDAAEHPRVIYADWPGVDRALFAASVVPAC